MELPFFVWLQNLMILLIRSGAILVFWPLAMIAQVFFDDGKKMIQWANYVTYTAAPFVSGPKPYP